VISIIRNGAIFNDRLTNFTTNRTGPIELQWVGSSGAIQMTNTSHEHITGLALVIGPLDQSAQNHVNVSITDAVFNHVRSTDQRGGALMVNGVRRLLIDQTSFTNGVALNGASLTLTDVGYTRITNTQMVNNMGMSSVMFISSLVAILAYICFGILITGDGHGLVGFCCLTSGFTSIHKRDANCDMSVSVRYWSNQNEVMVWSLLLILVPVALIVYQMKYVLLLISHPRYHYHLMIQFGIVN
jgi:hypothetical protein